MQKETRKRKTASSNVDEETRLAELQAAARRMVPGNRRKTVPLRRQNLTATVSMAAPERKAVRERGPVTVYFDQFSDRLVEWIQGATMVRGTMAWLTDPAVLDALGQVKGGVQLLLQNETFLTRAKDDYGNTLLSKYKALPCIKKETACLYSLGSASTRKQKPRLHSKWFIFYDQDKVPFAVWTGSWNATKCSNRSIENVIVLSDFIMAEWYHQEWLRLQPFATPIRY
jgi:hypothetical protein